MIGRLIRSSIIGGIILTTGSAAAETIGERLYFESCAVCHGEDGAGAMPGIRNLGGPEGPLSKATTKLVAIIMDGIDGPEVTTPMPARGGNDEITPELSREIIKFMRREFVK